MTFPDKSDRLFSVMRIHDKYFVEFKTATGRVPLVTWFGADHAGLEAAITFAKSKKVDVRCEVEPCDLSNSPHDWEVVWSYDGWVKGGAK